MRPGTRRWTAARRPCWPQRHVLRALCAAKSVFMYLTSSQLTKGLHRSPADSSRSQSTTLQTRVTRQFHHHLPGRCSASHETYRTRLHIDIKELRYTDAKRSPRWRQHWQLTWRMSRIGANDNGWTLGMEAGRARSICFGSVEACIGPCSENDSA